MTIKERIQNTLSDPGKRAPSIGAAFLLSLTVLFFGPSYMYYGNILEIPYFYSDMIWIFLAYSLAAAAIISAILLILKGTIHQRAVALVSALGLLFWIQGHVLVWDYGVLDGREIIWNDYLLNGIIDSAVWIAVLGVALFKAPSIYKHIAVASVLLLLVQGGGLAAEVYQAPDEPEWKSYAIGYDDTTMFEFSKEQNVVILVLDAFRSDIFQEIIDENDEYREMFDGFIYYRNAAGGYPHTDASIPLILTGEYYDNSIPRSEFVKTTFSNNSIPQTLMKNGYRVDLYPLLQHTIYQSKEVASNIGISERGQVDRVTDAMKGTIELQHLTLFRYMPHFLKSHFHFMPFVGTNRGDSTPHDLAFYNTLISEFNVSSEEKTFKFYHNVGPHGPLNLNADLHYEDLPFNETGYKEQAKASLKISGELVKQLKEHDIYEDSLIIIVGDHGALSAGHGVQNIVNTDLLSIGPALDGDEYRENWRMVAQGTPLVLVKPFNASGHLSISDAPVSLGDVPRTITSELQIPDEFSGQSILSINESDTRERKYFQYLSTNKSGQYYLELDYLPPLREYSINGHSWFRNSWAPTVQIYEPGQGLIPLPVYKSETEILFGKEGNAQTYQLAGWSGPEEGFTWTDGHNAVLAVQPENTDSDLALKITASPYLSGEALDQQRVTVYVNEHWVGEWLFDQPGTQEKTVLIPHNVLEGEIQYIAFEFPDATSPKDLGRSEDERDLAIAVHSMEIEGGQLWTQT
ncbi:sulfatase-like hydrolase/transferase [Methanoculleus oceani]|nr:sulfatase-like hydrolase/transferase [Methanoculleus sp. CWC-02]